MDPAALRHSISEDRPVAPRDHAGAADDDDDDSQAALQRLPSILVRLASPRCTVTGENGACSMHPPVTATTKASVSIEEQTVAATAPPSGSPAAEGKLIGRRRHRARTGPPLTLRLGDNDRRDITLSDGASSATAVTKHSPRAPSSDGGNSAGAPAKCGSPADTANGRLRWVAVLKKMFAELTGKSRCLGQEEFLRYFPLPGVMGERLFALFDRDNSGEIDFEEFFIGLCVIYNGTPAQRRRFLFDMYDLDGSGRISREECMAMLRHIPAALEALQYAANSGDGEGTSMLEYKVSSDKGKAAAAAVIRPSFTEAFITGDDNDAKAGVASRQQYSRKFIYTNHEDYNTHIAQIVADIWRDRPLESQLTFNDFCAALEANTELAELMDLFHDLGMPELPVPQEALSLGYDGPAELTSTWNGNTISDNFFSTQLRRWRRKFHWTWPHKRGSAMFERSSSSNTATSPASHAVPSYTPNPLSTDFQPDKEGWLLKLGRTFNLPRKRYFVLRDQFLYYFAKKNDSTPRKAIFLKHAIITPSCRVSASSTSRLWSFSVNLPTGKSLLLHSYAERDRDEWMVALRKAARVNVIHEDYVLMSPRGQGRFGVVHRAIDKANQESVAIKIVAKKSLDDYSLIRNEVSAMRLLRHPNIVQLLNVCDSTEFFYLVMEWVAAGDISPVVDSLQLHQVHPCNCTVWQHWWSTTATSTSFCVETWMVCERLALITARGLFAGLRMLHDCNVIHRDIKPENILIVSRKEHSERTVDDADVVPDRFENSQESRDTPGHTPGSTPRNAARFRETPRGAQDDGICTHCRECSVCRRVLDIADVKVGDFGFAKVLAPNASTQEQLGTMAYAAPEVLAGLAYGQKVDMWSAGVLLYQILSAGKLPFDSHNSSKQLAADVIASNFQFVPTELWRHYGDAAKSFISKLLNANANMRLSARESLQSLWLEEAR